MFRSSIRALLAVGWEPSNPSAAPVPGLQRRPGQLIGSLWFILVIKICSCSQVMLYFGAQAR
jgi:hypothetical protein